LWSKIAKTDPFMQKLKAYYLDPPHITHSAYYFASWTAVHKAYNDAMTAAVTGSRENIPKALAAGAVDIHNAAK
jgi:ABC-type branched-subunit amino acid transport system substrate-binding protein